MGVKTGQIHGRDHRAGGIDPIGRLSASYEIKMFADDEIVVPTNNETSFFFEIPDDLDGARLVFARAFVSTASTGDIQVSVINTRDLGVMLSTPITIDATTKTSKDAGTPPVIDPAENDVVEGDQIRIDVDTVAVEDGMGLGVILRFD